MLLTPLAKTNGVNISFDEKTTDSEIRKIFGDITQKVSNILFFELNNKTTQKDAAIDIILGLKRSYREYKKKMYDNYKQTFDIYDKIIEAEKTKGKSASIQAD